MQTVKLLKIFLKCDFLGLTFGILMPIALLKSIFI